MDLKILNQGMVQHLADNQLVQRELQIDDQESENNPHFTRIRDPDVIPANGGPGFPVGKYPFAAQTGQFIEPVTSILSHPYSLSEEFSNGSIPGLDVLRLVEGAPLEYTTLGLGHFDPNQIIHGGYVPTNFTPIQVNRSYFSQTLPHRPFHQHQTQVQNNNPSMFL